MSRKYHPDKLGAGGAQGEVWVAMREGYEVLMEPNARMAYDRYVDSHSSCAHFLLRDCRSFDPPSQPLPVTLVFAR